MGWLFKFLWKTLAVFLITVRMKMRSRYFVVVEAMLALVLFFSGAAQAEISPSMIFEAERESHSFKYKESMSVYYDSMQFVVGKNIENKYAIMIMIKYECTAALGSWCEIITGSGRYVIQFDPLKCGDEKRIVRFVNVKYHLGGKESVTQDGTPALNSLLKIVCNSFVLMDDD